MEDGQIQDGQITASSYSSGEYHGPTNARLNRPAYLDDTATTGAWSAATSDANQWIQVDLGFFKRITGIILQGRADADKWVTEYKVETSKDALTWQYVKSGYQEYQQDDLVRTIVL